MKVLKYAKTDTVQLMINKAITTSLLVSTYNWPQALNLCLLSIKAQHILPDEVIIADDGSGEETKNLINLHTKTFPVPLIHIWQPDKGFELSTIRNKGIAASTKNYIIQIDGDLILHPKFIADHINFARPGAFVTGSRVIMSEELSKKVLNKKDICINIFSKGISNLSNGFRFSSLRNLLAERYRNNDIYYMRGCNMAFWREDLLRVNGYNEEFIGWGREDNEIAFRLINLGIQKRILKMGAVVYHIWHKEHTRTDFNLNNKILADTIDNKIIKCRDGINKYLHDTSSS
ncbi:MAG TPA: glycosyltransferase family 2 protein [Sphingobacteriaceae bacterium]|nr:glycosyltransferase family 2 protein [Sphingobacteriaceae bacterium]